MPMASPPTWCRPPKADIAGSRLSLSTTSLAALYFRQPRRGVRIQGQGSLPRSSLHDSHPPASSSPPVDTAGERPDPEIRPASAGDERGKREPAARTGRSDAATPPAGIEGFAALNRRKSSWFGLKPFGRRSLWKRILFASKKVRGLILLNVVTVVYASEIPVLKEVEMIMDPALFTVVRFAASAIPFLPFVLQAREDRQTRSAGIELGFWVSLGYLSQALALLTSDAGRASFISAFTVVVVPLIDGLFGAAVPALTWSGAFVSLIGVAMLECDGSPPSVGDTLNLLSAVFFGIHILRTEHISRSTKREKFLALLGYEVIVVALSSAIWFLLRDIFGDAHQLSLGFWTWSELWDRVILFPWIPALYTGVFSTGLCLWAEIHAMRDISATETAIVYGLEPLWGAAFAWFLLGERWGTIEWIGAALILCGNLTVQILGSSPEKSKKGEENSKLNSSNASNKQSNLSLSTIVVNSRKDTADLLRKKEKL